jgi:RimJ/RimL family protein N-acetyltransferase
MPDIAELDTPRLRLRAWREADLAPFAALNADPAVVEFLPGPLSRAESDGLVERFRAHFAAHGFGRWAVERRDDGRFIGFVGISQVPFEAPFAPGLELAWRLARDSWGHGFATEAARAAAGFAFDRLGVAGLLAFTVPANQRSRAVMVRLGMTHDPAEDFDHPLLPEGHPLRRHVLYRLARGASGAGIRGRAP